MKKLNNFFIKRWKINEKIKNYLSFKILKKRKIKKCQKCHKKNNIT